MLDAVKEKRAGAYMDQGVIGPPLGSNPVNTRYSLNVGKMLVHCLRRWPNIYPA